MRKSRRGRPEPSYDLYHCTGCSSDRPTVRDGVHVTCRCGATPNPNLAKVYDLPEWPRVIRDVGPL